MGDAPKGFRKLESKLILKTQNKVEEVTAGLKDSVELWGMAPDHFLHHVAAPMGLRERDEGEWAEHVNGWQWDFWIYLVQETTQEVFCFSGSGYYGDRLFERVEQYERAD